MSYFDHMCQCCDFGYAPPGSICEACFDAYCLAFNTCQRTQQGAKARGKVPSLWQEPSSLDEQMECSLCGALIREPGQMCSSDTTPCNPVRREVKPLSIEEERGLRVDLECLKSHTLQRLLVTLDRERELANSRGKALEAEWARVQSYRDHMDRAEEKLRQFNVFVENGRTVSCGKCGETAYGICTHLVDKLAPMTDWKEAAEQAEHELDAMERRAEEQRRRAKVAEEWNSILTEKAAAAEAALEVERGRIARLHEEINATELGKIADELDEDNFAIAASAMRRAAVKIFKLEMLIRRVRSHMLDLSVSGELEKDLLCASVMAQIDNTLERK